MYGGFLSAKIADNYEIHEWRNAIPILATVHPQEWRDILDVLANFKLCKSFVTSRGGNKSRVAAVLDSNFYDKGWIEKQFHTAIVLDTVTTPSPTHKVDCFKGRVALEVEWNNKDPFFDRDLNNFRLLFDLRAIDVGVIITRTDGLQKIFNKLGRGLSYGMSTTHMSKLLPKIEGGGAGGCPVVVFGIKSSLYDENC